MSTLCIIEKKYSNIKLLCYESSCKHSTIKPTKSNITIICKNKAACDYSEIRLNNTNLTLNKTAVVGLASSIKDQELEQS